MAHTNLVVLWPTAQVDTFIYGWRSRFEPSLGDDHLWGVSGEKRGNYQEDTCVRL